jgi:hypothetical protein
VKARQDFTGAAISKIEKPTSFEYTGKVQKMLFKQFMHEEGACLSYILGCTQTGVAAMVEPQLDIRPYLDYLSKHKLQLTHILE